VPVGGALLAPPLGERNRVAVGRAERRGSAVGAEPLEHLEFVLAPRNHDRSERRHLVRESLERLPDARVCEAAVDGCGLEVLVQDLLAEGLLSRGNLQDPDQHRWSVLGPLEVDVEGP
jgi:hypothetical protein